MRCEDVGRRFVVVSCATTAAASRAKIAAPATNNIVLRLNMGSPPSPASASSKDLPPRTTSGVEDSATSFRVPRSTYLVAAPRGLQGRVRAAASRTPKQPEITLGLLVVLQFPLSIN